MKESLTRLATNRTYEVGKEQTFAQEQLLVLSSSPARVRATLSSIDNDVATFTLDIKTVVAVGAHTFPLFMRGPLRFDIKHARPLGLHIDATYDTPDDMSATGDFTLDYKFSY